MEINTLEYWNDYEVEVLSDLPKQGTTYIFQQIQKEQSNSNGLVLEVPVKTSDYLVLKVKSNDGFTWIGKFKPGLEGISGIYATPSESILCVVMRGQGYWVPVDSPQDYEIIPSIPIKKVIAVPKAEIMVFVDFVRLTAFDRNGLIWQTPSLSYDGLTINRVTSNLLEGTAWDAPNNQEIKFTVNILDGTSKGGASPEIHSVVPR